MTRKANVLNRYSFSLFVTSVLFHSLFVKAEITLDGTMGPQGNLAGPDYQITENLGSRNGANLFHSFGQFNLNAAERATFSGSAGIENVISRVTGGSPSSIDGQLRSTIPGADLYFLNPAGVMFGPNASLDLMGSFHVSTADVLQFQDNVGFTSMPSLRDQLLSSSPPESFGFARENPGGISLHGSQLMLPNGETLSIVGGDVEITSGIRGQNVVGSDIQAPEGRIDLVSVGGNTVIRPVVGDLVVAPIDPTVNVGVGDLSVNGGSSIQASGAGGEGIFVRGGNFRLAENANVGTVINTPGKGGDISVKTTGDVKLDGGAITTITLGDGDAGNFELISGGDFQLDNQAKLLTTTGTENPAFGVGSGSGGYISVSVTGQVVANSGSSIESLTYGPGNGSTVTIRSDGIVLDGFSASGQSGIFSNSIDPIPNSQNVVLGSGDAGKIDLFANELMITNGAQISAATGTKGNAGQVVIEVNSLLIDGMGNNQQSSITANSQIGTVIGGNAGNIKIKADAINLRNGGQIAAQTIGGGRGGDIAIEGASIVSVDGVNQGFTENGLVTAPSRISAATIGGVKDPDRRESARAGNITISSNKLSVSEGAQIDVVTRGMGRGGDLFIDVANDVTIRGSWLDSASSLAASTISGSGDAGSVTVKTNKLQVVDGGKIEAASFGVGAGGLVAISANDVRVDGVGFLVLNGIQHKSASLIGNSSGPLPTSTQLPNDFGPPGRISINTNHLKVTNGGQIVTTNMGSIKRNPDSISLICESAGDICITAKNVLISGESQGFFSILESGTRGSGDGGQINLVADNLEIRDKAQVASDTTFSGIGGDISIEARSIHLSNESGISSRSGGVLPDAGQSGNIFVTAHENLILSNKSEITVGTTRANAGSLEINTSGLLRLSKASKITTSVADGQGNGGNINLTPGLLILDNSQIIAKAKAGSGGEININNSIPFLRSGNSIIDASSDTGQDGRVNTNVPERSVSGSLSGLSEKALDASEHLVDRCAVRSPDSLGSFVLQGAEGFPAGPMDFSVLIPMDSQRSHSINTNTGNLENNLPTDPFFIRSTNLSEPVDLYLSNVVNPCEIRL